MKKAMLAGLIAIAVVGCEDKKTDAPTAKQATPSAAPSASAAPKSDEAPVTTTNAEARKEFDKALDEKDNVNWDAAREHFKKARQLDPKFASAMAGEGLTTPFEPGDKLLADAVAQSASLPEAEQIAIKQWQAYHASDTDKAIELAQKLVTLQPKSWRAQLELGAAYAIASKNSDAETAFSRSTELAPNQGAAFNWLAWTQMLENKMDKAQKNAEKVVELRPKDPNAHDTLGEVQMATGNFAPALAAFEKALAIDPTFIGANHGIGFTHLYEGKPDAALEALGKCRDKSPSLEGKGVCYATISMVQVTQNKIADAQKTLDAWDAEAASEKDNDSAIWAQVTRGTALIEANKGADAMKILGGLDDKIEKLEAPTSRKTLWRILQQRMVAVAAARMGKAADAQKALDVSMTALGSSTDQFRKGVVAHTRGLAALAKNDAKGAVEALKECTPVDDYCAWDRSVALEKAGDKDGAKATRDAVLKTHHRDAIYYLGFVHAKNGK